MEDEKLVERLAKVETEITGLQNYIREMRIDIKEIKNKLLGRPSWIVSLVITALVGAVVGLIKY